MKQLLPNSFVMGTLEDVRNQINIEQPVGFDIETIGLYGEIALAQFYQKHWDSSILVPFPEILELASTIRTWHLVMHNASYEVSTIQQQLGKVFGVHMRVWIPEQFDDTLLMSKLFFYKKETFALDDCYKYAFKQDPYAVQNLDKKAMQKANWAVLDEPKKQYASTDVFYLLDLYETCRKAKDSQAYQLDISATTNAFGFQVNGLPISVDRINQRIKENLDKVNVINLPVNANSYQQVRPYIGENESDGLALATFALEGNERAGKVQEVRKLLKENSFLNKFLDEAVDERIFGKFTFTTKSGRGNCKDQNLQQLPRTTKSMFEAGEGKVFVMSDYAQLELRMICAVSGDEVMEARLRNGDDLHSFTAEEMNVPRQQAKTCNFNLTYGGSAKMLRSIFITDANMLLDLEIVKALKTGWHALWSGITKWQQDMTKRWQKGGHFETLLGRRMSAKLYTDAMNLPIQGSSAEVSKLAMHRMFKAIDENDKLKEVSKFCNFVHDSFHWECPDDPKIYEPLAKLTAESMKSAWEDLVKFTKIPDLPMPVDVVVGKNWGDLEYEIETPKFQLTL